MLEKVLEDGRWERESCKDVLFIGETAPFISTMICLSALKSRGPSEARSPPPRELRKLSDEKSRTNQTQNSA